MTPDQLIRRFAIVAALIGIAACASDVAAPLTRDAGLASTASRQDKGGDPHRFTTGNGQGAGNANQPKPVSCTGRRTIASSGRFGPGGGTLTLGNTSLVIPGGALHDTVTITATQLDDGTSTVRFAPHGLHFYKPAGLTLDGSSCNLPPGGMASVVYVDEDGNVLETIHAYYDPHWKRVAAPIVHFSGYAIAF